MGKTRKRDPVEEHILSMATKVLHLPVTTEAKPKQPSKKLRQIVSTIGSTFMKLEDAINEALVVGREEGFTDIEIGNMIRAEFKRLNRPRMTLSRYLPVTAKHMEKSRPKSDFGNNMLPNRPNEISKLLPQQTITTASTTTGRWNQAPDDYDIEKLDEYDIDYLREIVRWNHYGRENLIKEAFKWQAQFDEMGREKKALQTQLRVKDEKIRLLEEELKK
jgi:hypothetical protein